jgi:3-mercaptopyruvate sulfurtransferase SseA
VTIALRALAGTLALLLPAVAATTPSANPGLREIFEAAGVRPDGQIVTYCQSGSRSAHDCLALRLLGDARIENYDGSWNEWANDPVLPVAR